MTDQHSHAIPIIDPSTGAEVEVPVPHREDVNRAIDNTVDEVQAGAEQVGEAVKSGVDTASTKLREGKAAVENAANKAADKTERVVDQAQASASNAANQAANAATSAANKAGSTVQGIQSRVMQSVGQLRERAQTYSRDPSQLGSAIKYQLDARVKDRLLVIFLMMWAPIWVMAAGSGLGTILSLFLHNLNYVIAIGAAGYVWTLLNSTGPLPQYSQKVQQLLLISSALPIFILDVSNPLLIVATLLAFAGAPFIFSLIYSSGAVTGEKEDLSKVSAQERFIQFATASSVIFGLSVLPGDNNLFHRLFIAVVFAGAAFATNILFPIVLSKVPPHLRTQVDPHQVVIFALLEIIIGDLLLFILSYLLPQDVLDNENSGGGMFLYTLIGLLFLAFGNVLSNNFLTENAKLPPATVALVKKAGAGAIVGSYLVLTLTFILHLGPFGISQ